MAKTTIANIVERYEEQELDGIELDYCGDKETFNGVNEIPQDIYDDQATATVKDDILYIKVK